MTLISLFIALSGGGIAFGQGSSSDGDDRSESVASEAQDEVVVRGRRLTDLRWEVQTARERAYDIFNEINSSDDFDIYCHNERRYHSRATRLVCRARFEGRISGDAAQEYLAALRWRCPDPAALHDCMFEGGGASGAARSAAQGIEGQAAGKRNSLNEEIQRLAREDLRFAQAILDFYEASQQLEAARNRRDD